MSVVREAPAAACARDPSGLTPEARYAPVRGYARRARTGAGDAPAPGYAPVRVTPGATRCARAYTRARTRAQHLSRTTTTGGRMGPKTVAPS